MQTRDARGVLTSSQARALQWGVALVLWATIGCGEGTPDRRSAPDVCAGQSLTEDNAPVGTSFRCQSEPGARLHAWKALETRSNKEGGSCTTKDVRSSVLTDRGERRAVSLVCGAIKSERFQDEAGGPCRKSLSGHATYVDVDLHCDGSVDHQVLLGARADIASKPIAPGLPVACKAQSVISNGTLRVLQSAQLEAARKSQPAWKVECL